MTARDEAVRLAIKLFAAIFKRIWITFGEREQQLIADWQDAMIDAAVERILQDGDTLDLDDDDPPPPAPVRRYAATPGYERERVPAIPHEVR